MRAKTALPTLLLLASGTAGCAGFIQPARMHKIQAEQAYWFDYDASRRGAYLIPKGQGDTFIICAEPFPDVALDLVNKLKIETKGAPSGEYESGAEVLELAQRTQTIMFLREALFRLCELQANQSLDADTLQTMYRDVIKITLELAEADTNRAKASRAGEEANLLKARIEAAKLKAGVAIDEVPGGNPGPGSGDSPPGE